MRSTERLIDILRTVNATAIDNDGGKPGEFLAEICREAAERLRELESAHKERIEQIGEFLASKGYEFSNGGDPIDEPITTSAYDEVFIPDPKDITGPVGERMTEEELLRGLEDLFPKDEDGNRGC